MDKAIILIKLLSDLILTMAGTLKRVSEMSEEQKDEQIAIAEELTRTLMRRL